MKKEQVLHLMDAIEPDLIEEADLQAPAKRRMPKAVRTGLIAACLCLALLGTAFAANPEAVAEFINRFTPVQAEPVVHEDGAAGYHISFAPSRYPIDSFSPALLAAGENRESDFIHFEFDTWDEAHAFIGESIPCVIPGAGENWEASFRVDLTYNQDRLIDVMVASTGAAPWVRLMLMTEYSRADATGMDHLVMVGEPGSQSEVLAPYQMANGCQAQITRIIYPDAPGDTLCFATFVQDGILYTVTTGGSLHYSEEELLALLYDTLDLFA